MILNYYPIIIPISSGGGSGDLKVFIAIGIAFILLGLLMMLGGYLFELYETSKYEYYGSIDMWDNMAFSFGVVFVVATSAIWLLVWFIGFIYTLL